VRKNIIMGDIAMVSRRLQDVITVMVGRCVVCIEQRRCPKAVVEAAHGEAPAFDDEFLVGSRAAVVHRRC